MSIKQFMESEIVRLTKIHKDLEFIKTEIGRKEDIIYEIKQSNKASVDNFHYDWGFYYPWFKENFPQYMKAAENGQPYGWITNNGTKEEKDKIWTKEIELGYEGVDVVQWEINRLKEGEKQIVEQHPYLSETYITYEGGYTYLECLDIILSYLNESIKSEGIV